MMANLRRTQKLTNTLELINTSEVLSLSTADILTQLGTSSTGITTAEATKRLQLYGPNEIVKSKDVSSPRILLPL